MGSPHKETEPSPSFLGFLGDLPRSSFMDSPWLDSRCDCNFILILRT
jgi:hypothetical protein